MDRKNRELTETRRQLEHRNRDLERLSALDTLTQIANRRRFDAVLRQEWRRAARDESPALARLLRHRLLQALQRHLRPPGRRRVPRARGPGHGGDAQPPRRPRGPLRGRGVHRPPRRHRRRGRAHAGRADARRGSSRCGSSTAPPTWRPTSRSASASPRSCPGPRSGPRTSWTSPTARSTRPRRAAATGCRPPTSCRPSRPATPGERLAPARPQLQRKQPQPEHEARARPRRRARASRGHCEARSRPRASPPAARR